MVLGSVSPVYAEPDTTPGVTPSVTETDVTEEQDSSGETSSDEKEETDSVTPSVSPSAGEESTEAGSSGEDTTEGVTPVVTQAVTDDMQNLDIVPDGGLSAEASPSPSAAPKAADPQTPEGETEFHAGYLEIEEEAPETVSSSSGAGRLRSSSLPSSYINPNMPALANQGGHETCWAFSSLALAQLNLMQQGYSEQDLSELHLAYFTYNSVTDPLGNTAGDTNRISPTNSKNFLRIGGNLTFSQNVLASWTGAADEDTAPYSQASDAAESGLSSSLAFDDSVHLKSYYVVNIESNPNEVKKLVRNNGGVSISYYSQSGVAPETSATIYNSETNSYYNPNARTERPYQNHAVTIVGWDDDYPKENFANRPQNNGAWLIRNSWTNGGYYEDEATHKYAGYFWMSYEEKTLGESAYSFVFDAGDNYDNNYQYDGGMYTDYYPELGSTDDLTAANIFSVQDTSEWGESLGAIGFYTPSTNADYTVDIYRNITDGSDPTSGEKVATKTGTTLYSGFYNVELDEPVYLKGGSKFSIVVNIKKSSGARIGSESDYYENGLSLSVSAGEGQSFEYAEGTWVDYGANNNANLRIKGYTDTVDPIRVIFKLDGGRFEKLGTNAYTITKESSANDAVRSALEEIGLSAMEEPVKAGYDFGGWYTVDTAADQTEANRFDLDAKLYEDTYVYAKWTPKTEDEKLLKTMTESDDGQAYSVTAMAADKVFSDKEGNYLTTVTIYNFGRKLKAGRDYDKDFTYTYVRDTELYDGTIRKAGDGAIYSGKRDKVPAGTTMRVRVDGKGAYNGVRMYTSFRIVAGDLSKASVTVYPQYYTGEPVKPDHNQIVVKLGGTILTDNDYDIEYPETGNTEPGKNATLTIKGRSVDGKYVGDYGGSKTVKFTILERPEQSIISFNPNGATSGKMKDIKLEYGREYKLTANAFKRSYYEFTGWNTYPEGDMDGTGTHYDDRQVNPIVIGELDPTEIHILYAQWKPIDYTITFHCNGGPNNEDNIGITGYNAASEDIHIKSPEREDWPKGYQFGGWYTDSSYRNKMNIIKSGSHGNIDFYAKWIPYTYTVHFDANGGTGSMKDETFSYGVPKAISANKFKKAGYVFAGWTADRALSDTDVMSLLDSTDATEEDFAALADYADKQSVANILDNEDNFKGEVTLYALWRNIYRLNFEIGEGAVWGNGTYEILPDGMISTGPAGARRYYMSYSYGTGTALPTAKDIFRPGYSFGGWYKDPMYKSRVKSIAKKKTGEITLYAKWNPLKYKISFKPAFKENGKGRNSGKMSALTCTYGMRRSLTSNAYISMGYRFKGWSVDEDETVEFADQDITENLESYEGAEVKILPTKNNQTFNLYAVWEELPDGKYKIQYETNGGEFTEIHLEEYAADLKLVYSDLPTSDYIEREGYKLKGWYTDPDCKKKFKSVKGRDITLYAKWEGDARFSVDYLPNLPEGVSRYTGKMARTTGFIIGTPKALRKNTYKIPGYSFVGWKTKGKEIDPDAEKQYEYENNQKISLDNTYLGYPIIDGVLTLEAVWHKDTYGIVYNNTIGAVNDDNPVTYDVDTDDIILKEPQMTGNTFLGWYKDRKFKKKITKIPKGSTGNKTFYAKWKTMYYTIQYDLNPPDDNCYPVLDMTHVGYIVSYDKNYDGGYLLPTATLEDAEGNKNEEYTFGGWYKDKKGKKKVGQVIKSPYVDIVLYAKWIEDVHVTHPRITGDIEQPATCFNVVDYGAVAGDGLDDLAAFRAALKAADESSTIKTVYVPAGVYDIKPENPHKDGQPAIHLKNNVDIVMDRKAILKAVPVSMSGDYCIICGEENDNVTITGGQICGERSGHLGKTGESGHGIYLAKCSNITIEKMVIKSNWGDGIYVADRKVYDTFMESENITVRTCELVDNRRNNISLISGKGVTIEDCEIESKRKGTSPDCGICIEPNWQTSHDEEYKIIHPSQYIENLLIKDTRITAYKPNDSDYRSFMTLQYAPNPNFTTAKGIKFRNSIFNGYIGNYSGRNLTYDSKTVFNATFDDWCNAKKVD